MKQALTTLLCLVLTAWLNPVAARDVNLGKRDLSATPFKASVNGISTRFEPMSAATTGIAFINPLDEKSPLRYLYHSGTACGGVAIGDVDGDGRPDLYFVSGPGRNRLFRQTGDFRFTDAIGPATVDGGEAWGTGATMADVDNDGDLDLYVCNYAAPNLLYLNRGDGSFTEAAADAGVDLNDASLQPAFCDYDLDGDLDLYVLTNRLYLPGGRPKGDVGTMKDGKPHVLPQYEKYYGVFQTGPNDYTIEFVGRPDRLYRNDSRPGAPRFTDVSDAAGIHHHGHGLSATWWDYDDDGDPDLYVGNDFEDPDHLYRNNGDGTFTDVAAQVVPHTPWFSMGADAGDLDNDGRLDLLIADMAATTHFVEKTTMGDMRKFAWFMTTSEPRQMMRNALYLNTGTGRFREAAFLTGLAKSNWTWAVKIADFDHDGRADVFLTNGTARNTMDSDVPIEKFEPGVNVWDMFRRAPARPEPNMAFRNRGELRFDEVTAEWGLGHHGMSYAAAHGDLDGDGDLDLVVANLGEPAHLYRNETNDARAVTIRLVGTRSNRFGIGAVVRIETDTGIQVRQLQPMTGYLSGNEPILHFGLGDDRIIRRLTVTWPRKDGRRLQTFEHLDAGHAYTITEGDGMAEVVADDETPMFRRAKTKAIRHRERPYDDFRRQPLLPNKLSQLGPGIACGDVDGDGDDDFFLGGAAGDSGTLCIHRGDGRMQASIQPDFFADDESEDMGSLLFDADCDGDLDLYVVSGGIECDEGDERLRDRMYLNDGRGEFSRAPTGALPDLRDSGGAVCAADFDRDGDLDLFVGGRVVPGRYPTSPASRILRNEDGRFTDVTKKVAPTLERCGMVTGATWSDADGDGWIDLLVAREWGPVGFWRNDRGTLVDRTAEAGLADRTGWWNGIAARDLDGDGDIDYVATNFGLNTKYQPTEAAPALIYYGDFDGTGRAQIIEAADKKGILLPVRGKSCSQLAMPHLEAKFPTYRSFAGASLIDIYTPQCLKDALRCEAAHLESGVLVNDGTGRFAFHPLPRIAQVSPGFGVVLTDVDADGAADLYMVQNFHHPQRETGRMDGGLSQLMRGAGDGTFSPVGPDRSGLAVPQDARSVSASDVNGDGALDFVVGVNDGPLQIWLAERPSTDRFVQVRLRGRAGNPSGIGARVTVQTTDHKTQTAEVTAGSGYLSQSGATLVYGVGGARVDRITVRWPDGTTSIHHGRPTGPLEQPAADPR
ncbi:MAG: RNA-binding protein [Phycisphaeraceae bacterium]|nr:RNA-binding protein [Phycisphaeraceae bacterium]